jgi:hypothetical protein
MAVASPPLLLLLLLLGVLPQPPVARALSMADSVKLTSEISLYNQELVGEFLDQAWTWLAQASPAATVGLLGAQVIRKSAERVRETSVAASQPECSTRFIDAPPCHHTRPLPRFIHTLRMVVDHHAPRAGSSARSPRASCRT